MTAFAKPLAGWLPTSCRTKESIMTFNNAQPHSHRQLLVHCSVSSGTAPESSRFVDQQIYPLWRENMANRHNLCVTYLDTCVWLPEPEFLWQRQLFQHSGRSEAVTRLAFTVYHPTSHVTEHKVRFIRTQDEATLIPLLERHLLPNDDASELTHTSGWAVNGVPQAVAA